MNRIYTAREIMVAKLVTLKPETSVIDGIRRLLDNRVTGAPVVDRRGRYLGMFSEKCCMDVLVGAARVYTERQGDLPSIRAADIMARNLITLTPDMDVFDAIGLLLDRRISGAPVLDDDGKLVGVVSEFDCLRVVASGLYGHDGLEDSTPLRRLMTAEVLTITPDTDVFTVTQLLVGRRIRRVPVVDVDGKLVGIISRRDVLRCVHDLRREHMRAHRQHPHKGLYLSADEDLPNPFAD